MSSTDVSRSVGWVLLAGAVVFWAGALTPPYRQWMTPSLEEYLRIIGANARAWRIMHGLFAAGAVLTLIGLSALTSQLRGTRATTWATIALTLFAVSVALWLVQLGFRLTITPWAAAVLAVSGRIPAVYIVLHRWVGLLFAAYMSLGYVAEAAYGVALLNASILPRWAGWMAACVGATAIPGLATPVFRPPLVLEIVPFALGIAIVRNSAR